MACGRLAGRDEHDLGRGSVLVHLGCEQRDAFLQCDSGYVGLGPEVVGEGAQQGVAREALDAAAQGPVQQLAQCGRVQLLEPGLHGGHLDVGADVHQPVGDGVHFGAADVREVGLLGGDVGGFDGVGVDEDDLAHPAPREVLGVGRRAARPDDHHAGAVEKSQVIGVPDAGEHLGVQGWDRRLGAQHPDLSAMDRGQARPRLEAAKPLRAKGPSAADCTMGNWSRSSVGSASRRSLAYLRSPAEGRVEPAGWEWTNPSSETPAGFQSVLNRRLSRSVSGV